jgi:hypothetical protein
VTPLRLPGKGAATTAIGGGLGPPESPLTRPEHRTQAVQCRTVRVVDAASSVALIAGLLALIGVVAQLHQKDRADRETARDARREAWWARVEWCLEQVLVGGESRVVGLLMISVLVRSDLASDEDKVMLRTVAETYR